MRVAVLSIDGLSSKDSVHVSLRLNIERSSTGAWVDKAAGWSKSTAVDVASDVKVAMFRPVEDTLANWSTSTGERIKALQLALSNLLLNTVAGAEWMNLWQECRTENIALRSFLELKGFVEAWPWELLRDLRNPININDYFFAATKSPASRLVRSRLQPSPTPWPIKVLLVVGPDIGGRNIDSNQERRALHRLFAKHRHDVECRFLIHPQAQAIGDEIGSFKPDIFHFMGHGGGDVGGEGHLVVGSAAAATEWTTTQIAIAFGEDRPRVCVVLNACGTGANPSLAEVSNAFLAGTPAVIAMGAEIQGASAAVFAEAFYTSLLNGTGVEGAAMAARTMTQRRAPATSQWAIPRLLLSHASVEESAPLQAFERRAPWPSDSQPAIFKDLRFFVDRQAERKSLIETVARNRAVWLRGSPEVGKSLLAKWFYERMLYHGAEARFLDFSEHGSDRTTTLSSFVGVLRVIRDGSEVQRQRLAFHGFNVACNALFSGKVPPVQLPAQFELDGGLAFDVERHVPGNWREVLGARFLEALRLQAANGPVSIVFDAFHDCIAPTQEDVVNFLITPLVNAPIANVTLVVETKEGFTLLDSVSNFSALDVPSFPGQARQQILGDFTELLVDDQQITIGKRALDYILATPDAAGPQWDGKLFDRLRTLLGFGGVAS